MSEAKQVKVILKSGVTMVFLVTEFELTLEGGRVTGLKWAMSENSPERIAFLDLDEIAAVTQVGGYS
jgi:hypothetical protein